MNKLVLTAVLAASLFSCQKEPLTTNTNTNTTNSDATHSWGYFSPDTAKTDTFTFIKKIRTLQCVERHSQSSVDVILDKISEVDTILVMRTLIYQGLDMKVIYKYNFYSMKRLLGEEIENLDYVVNANPNPWSLTFLDLKNQEFTLKHIGWNIGGRPVHYFVYTEI
jgi:hypothetical protein